MLTILFINYLRLIVIAIIFLILLYFWLFRIRHLIDGYLKALCALINCQPKKKLRLIPLYSKNEVVGTYKEREVSGGICYLGNRFEWMPLPYIKIKLKQVIRYNYNRIPDFAHIEHGWLVLKVTERLPWGLLDRGYKKLFTKEYITIMLARLLVVVEDVERGRTMEELFKNEHPFH